MRSATNTLFQFFLTVTFGGFAMSGFAQEPQTPGPEHAHKVLTMTGTTTGADGKLQKFRNTTELKGTDKMTFKMFVTAAPEAKEELAFTIEYNRRK